MKRVSVIVALMLLLVFIMSVVSAQNETSSVPDLGKLVGQIKGFFTPVLKAIFGDKDKDTLFEQLLFALIIIAFVYMALSRVDVIRNNAFALWTVTIVIAILSVRYIATEGLVKALLMPQGVFGISLIIVIPFVLWFWFVEFGLGGAGSRVMRKIAWVVFAVVFGFLWWKAYYILPTEELKQWNHLYLVVAIASVVLMLVDGSIQGAIRKSRAATHLDVIREREISKIRKKMDRASEELEGDVLEREMKRLRQDLDKAIKIGK